MTTFIINGDYMEETLEITVREFKARLSHYMREMRNGKKFCVRGHTYGEVTTAEDSVTTGSVDTDCLPGEKKESKVQDSEKEAEEPTMAKCFNCKEKWDIEEVPCYEAWNEDLGEDVIVCDKCMEFKSGGSKKIYKSLLKTMKKL